jgi:hypothetical protein
LKQGRSCWDVFGTLIVVLVVVVVVVYCYESNVDL